MREHGLIAARVLVVDDQASNVLLLKRLLERDGFSNIKTSTDSREVLPLFAAFDPDILLLDLHMPNVDGFEVMGQLARELGQDTFVPTVVLTADASRDTRQLALGMGANDFLTKPFDPTEVLLRVRNLLNTRLLHLRLADRTERLEAHADEQRLALEDARIEVLDRLARAADLRDNETHAHTQRVGDMSALLAGAVGLADEECEILRRAAPMHDIGKIGVTDAVLLKPGKLTEEEFAHVKTHALVGAELLSGSPIPIVQAAEKIAIAHHERWDGSGYPHGLAGLAIPQHARIVAVADVFDALTHARPYKAAWPIDRAVEEILSQRGRHFDPEVVDAFVGIVRAELVLKT